MKKYYNYIRSVVRSVVQQKHWGGLRIHLIVFVYSVHRLQSAVFKILKFCRILLAGFRMLPDISKYCRISGAAGYPVHPYRKHVVQAKLDDEITANRRR